MNRYVKCKDPDIKSGKWSFEEDVRLACAVSAYGAKNWTYVKTHVPHRTDVQCRERWVNVLDPSIRLDGWTAEEDAKLWDTVTKMGGPGNWNQVAKELPMRTDNQVCCF